MEVDVAYFKEVSLIWLKEPRKTHKNLSGQQMSLVRLHQAPLKYKSMQRLHAFCKFIMIITSTLKSFLFVTVVPKIPEINKLVFSIQIYNKVLHEFFKVHYIFLIDNADSIYYILNLLF